MFKYARIRRSRLAGLFAVAISLCAVGALIAGSVASAEEVAPEAVPAGTEIPLAGCPGGKLCLYNETGASGERFGGFTCTPGFEETIGIEYLSARNNCGANAAEIGWNENGSTNWKACLNSGGNVRTEPGRVNTFRILGGASC
jgi:hypothetical protein